MIKHIYSIGKFIIKHPLNQKHQTSALLKFLKWQIGMRLIGAKALFNGVDQILKSSNPQILKSSNPQILKSSNPQILKSSNPQVLKSDVKALFNWVDDARMLVARGETGLTGNLYAGFMEYEDMCFLLHYLKADDYFIDVGANVGAYTILASKVVGAKSVVYEPLPSTFERLLDQIYINRINDKVTCINKGVGHQKGSLEFTNDLNCTNRVNTDPNHQNVTQVEVVTLDAEHPNLGSTVVKIDVEGFEMNVLKGGRGVFSNPHVRAVIMETNGNGKLFGVKDSDLHNQMLTFGFTPISYDPINRKISSIQSHNLRGNTLYVRDVINAVSRCQAAKKFVVHTANAIEI